MPQISLNAAAKTLREATSGASVENTLQVEKTCAGIHCLEVSMEVILCIYKYIQYYLNMCINQHTFRIHAGHMHFVALHHITIHEIKFHKLASHDSTLH